VTLLTGTWDRCRGTSCRALGLSLDGGEVGHEVLLQDLTRLGRRQDATEDHNGAETTPSTGSPHVDAHWMLDLWHDDHLAPKAPDSFGGAPRRELLFAAEGGVAPIVVGMTSGKGKSKLHVRACNERLHLGCPLPETKLEEPTTNSHMGRTHALCSEHIPSDISQGRAPVA